MIGHRPPTILTIAITALAAISSPIWGFEIENYWLNTARPYVVANAWSWVVTVLDYLSGFWGGVLAVLLVWGLTEAFITWRRNRYNPTQVSPTEAPTLTLEFGPEEPFVINAPFVRGSTLPPTTGFFAHSPSESNEPRRPHHPRLRGALDGGFNSEKRQVDRNFFRSNRPLMGLQRGK